MQTMISKRYSMCACILATALWSVNGCTGDAKRIQRGPVAKAIFSDRDVIKLDYDYSEDVAYRASDARRATLIEALAVSGYFMSKGEAKLLEVINCEERLPSDDATAKYSYISFVVLDMTLVRDELIANIQQRCPWVVIIPKDSERKLLPGLDQIIDSESIGEFPVQELNWVTSKQHHRVSTVVASRWTSITVHYSVIENIGYQVQLFSAKGRWLETGVDAFSGLADAYTYGQLHHRLVIDQVDVLDDFARGKGGGKRDISE